MYLEALADLIGEKVDPTDDDHRMLHLLYAYLVRVKGDSLTMSDVHDAWSVWTILADRDREFVVPFDQLPTHVQEQDRTFAEALASVARSTS
ncbi:MAG: hypothetical protein ACJ72D_30905 [Marmoricola sp.]